MTCLRARLFGGFELSESNGAELKLSTRKARALLAFLIVEADRWHTRDRLAGLLWSDRQQAQARHSLTQALSVIRKLGDAAGQQLIESDGERVRLLAHAVDADVLSFREAEKNEPSVVAETYAGRLLDGFNAPDQAFEDWLRVEQSAHHRAACSALRSLAEHAEANNDLAAAISAVERLVTLDPTNETTHRQLMRLHVTAGNRSEAIRQYDRCERLIREELGLKPSAETTALVRAIRTGDETAKIPPLLAASPKPVSQEVEPLSRSGNPSIAVLPFENLSSETDQDFLSDGITEDVTSNISKYRWLRVIAGRSTYTYKGLVKDVREIAKELGVRYLLEGSIRRVGPRVRISAKLADAERGNHLWSEIYDREIEDIFDLQDEITRQVAAMLMPQLELAELRRSFGKKPENLDAWDYYLRGLAFEYEFSQAGNRNARDMYTKATELDPAYAKAFSHIAITHSVDLVEEFSDDFEGSLAAGFEAARHAISLDGEDSLAHTALANAYRMSDQHDLAVAEAKRAVEINPSDAFAYMMLGNLLDLSGYPDQALLNLKRALQLSPRDTRAHMFAITIARAYCNSRDYNAAIEWARKAQQLAPDDARGYVMYAIGLAHLNRIEEAHVALSESERTRPGFAQKWVQNRRYQNASDQEHLMTGLRKICPDA